MYTDFNFPHSGIIMVLYFYAYAKNVSQFIAQHSVGLTFQSRDNGTWRYIIVFADREMVDEGWCAVFTANNANPAASISRLTPTHDRIEADISNSLYHAFNPDVFSQF
jgi:hypothetical protein